jgi:D-threo-aldose 1-dehydrogenase
MRTRPFGRAALHVTELGYGGAPIGNIFRTIAEDEAEGLVVDAWGAGIRSFDTAPMYGHGLSEHRLGHVLLGLPREEYVLSTKVGRTLHPAPRGSFDSGVWVDVPPFKAEFDYGYDATMRQVEDSLQRMCQDRFDILYVHDVDRYTHGDAQAEMFEAAVGGAFRALTDLREQRVVSAIGVGVNEVDVCQATVDRVDIDCLLLAGRYTLLENGAALGLLAEYGRRGIAVTAGGIFNSGILATGPVSAAKFNYSQASADIAERAGRIAGHCSRHGVALGAAAVQFALANPSVTQVLLGSRSRLQQEEAIGWAQDAIPSELWADLRNDGLLDVDAPVPGTAGPQSPGPASLAAAGGGVS